jgi:hypothetical protein
MRSPVWILICAGVAGASVFGYMKTRGKIDTADADAKIKEAFETAIGPVDKVDCPDGASRKKGSTFECQITFTGGKTYPVKIEIYGDDGQWKPAWTTPILGGEKTAADITTTFATQAPGLKVDCGKGVFEIPKDGYLCSATDAKGSGHIRVKYDEKTDHVLYNAEP